MVFLCPVLRRFLYLCSSSAAIPGVFENRWLTSQVKGVDASGCQIFTSKTTYILEGKLFAQGCDPQMPNFIKFHFKVSFLLFYSCCARHKILYSGDLKSDHSKLRLFVDLIANGPVFKVSGQKYSYSYGRSH